MLQVESSFSLSESKASLPQNPRYMLSSSRFGPMQQVMLCSQKKKTSNAVRNIFYRLGRRVRLRLDSILGSMTCLVGTIYGHQAIPLDEQPLFASGHVSLQITSFSEQKGVELVPTTTS
jgi:hypothetical protein